MPIAAGAVEETADLARRSLEPRRALRERPMRVALDTNILAYAEGLNDKARHDAVLERISALPRDATVIPIQALSELFTVLVRKAGKSRKIARERLLGWTDSFPRPYPRVVLPNRRQDRISVGEVPDHVEFFANSLPRFQKEDRQNALT